MSHRSAHRSARPVPRFVTGVIWLGMGVAAVAFLALLTTPAWQGIEASVLGTQGTVLGLVAFAVTVVVGSAVAIAAVWLMFARDRQIDYKGPP